MEYPEFACIELIQSLSLGDFLLYDIWDYTGCNFAYVHFDIMGLAEFCGEDCNAVSIAIRP
jgi:hypothetical protein